jgi:hypothetical protein
MPSAPAQFIPMVKSVVGSGAYPISQLTSWRSLAMKA